MPYIGNIPAEKYAAFNVQYFTTSATTSYTLDRAVANELDIRLVINNVIQEPGAGKAYTAAGTTLTLTSATAGTDTMYAVYIGKAVQTVNPGANSVGPTALQDNSVTNAKLADATQGDVIYYGAAGAPAQLSAGTNGHFLKTQGAGANPTWAAVPDSGITYGEAQRPNAIPLVYNGNCAIAQRGTSQTGVSSGPNYPVDRFQLYPTNLGTYTIIQEALTSGNAFDNGFRTALRIDTTTADASPSATDYLILAQKFEGQDLQVIKKGSSNAEKLTLAFWVKSNKTTTGQVNLFEYQNNRLVSGTYTVSVANTWEKKIINFPADTTGAFTNSNVVSLGIEWFLDSGSNFSSGTAPTAWETQSNGDRNANNFALASSTANDFAITGVQLEVGEFSSTTIPPFEFETVGDNLARCQRYYYFHVSEAENGGSDTTISLTSQYNPSSMKGFITFPTRMRTKPTLKQNTGSNMYRVYENNSNATMTSLTLSSETTYNTGVFTAGSTISVTSGSSGTLQTMDSTAFVAFDAEL